MSHFAKPKIKKSELPPKTQWTVHDPHSKDISLRNELWKQPYLQFTTIDPGSKNLGLRIERRYHAGYYQPIVYIVYNVGITEEDELNCTVYKKLTTFLTQYLPLFMETHLFSVERQLPENYRAVRISQHIISFLMHHLMNAPLLPIIYELESKLKYRMLGAPTHLNHQTLKKVWGPAKAIEILTLENDTLSLNVINASKKKDDLGDVVLLRRVLELILGLVIFETTTFTIPTTKTEPRELTTFLQATPTIASSPAPLPPSLRII